MVSLYLNEPCFKLVQRVPERKGKEHFFFRPYQVPTKGGTTRKVSKYCIRYRLLSGSVPNTESLPRRDGHPGASK